MNKVQLSWNAHVEAAPRHRSDFLDDIREKAFDWDGDLFWMESEDFMAISTKHWVGPSTGSNIRVPSLASQGLGDTIEKVTRAMGVKKPCGGCKKRKDKLNRIFPYRQRSA
tara:strand:+ start:2551 stop:2883 length:333 start_codon:yes stop_codon:yes gene_type:complete